MPEWQVWRQTGGHQPSTTAYSQMGKLRLLNLLNFRGEQGPAATLVSAKGKKPVWLVYSFLFFSLQDWALELGPNGMLGKCSPMDLHPWVSPFLLRYGLKVALPAFGSISSWGCSWIYNPPAKVSLLIAGITDFLPLGLVPFGLVIWRIVRG